MASPTIYMTNSSLSLNAPKGLAIDPDLQRILICDYANLKLILCKLDGLAQITTVDSYDGNPIIPWGATYYNGYYYVCNSGYHTVIRFKAKDLSYKDHFGVHDTSGSTTSRLNTPLGCTTDGQYLYITDYNNGRIMKLVLKTLAYHSQASNINGALANPYGIVYKREGGEALFITEYIANRIIKCKTDFTYISQNSSNVLLPAHLAFDDDYLYVADFDDVKVFSSNNLISVKTYEDETLSQAVGIAIHRDSMFISDSRNNTVSIWRKYNPRDSFTPSTPAKFGGKFFDQPVIIVGEDEVIVGDTQEYGTPNHWIEQITNNYGYAWDEETALDSTWTEETRPQKRGARFDFGRFDIARFDDPGGFIEETKMTSSWTEESAVSSTWTEES